MIQPLIRQNVSLQALNTFGFAARAEAFVSVTEPVQLSQLPYDDYDSYLVLGGGSNILFTADIGGLVIHNSITGIEVLRENDRHVWVRCGAGVIWHDLVCWTLAHDFGGLENLSLIPGSAGAAPIQNIGAYGVELADICESVACYMPGEDRFDTLDAASCRFGYRNSIFKQELKGRAIVTAITLRLDKPGMHRLNTAYGAIREELASEGIGQPDIHAISRAVIRIRQSKLPDPAVLGNAGSFFKNPVLPGAQWEALIAASDRGIPHFPQADGTVKVPAGWLIEQCGWKGRRSGHVGCHKDQALVLVHFGGGEGREILRLAEEIIESVEQRFGILLQPEVNII